MELELKRDTEQPQHATLGKLYVDGAYACETLEDIVREVPDTPVTNWKVPGDTAIPRGRYRVIVNHSQRFGRDMPLLLGVSGFDGIRIHPGNFEKDTEGCILVGTDRSDVGILNSRIAFNELFADIQEAISGGEQVWIGIS